MSDRQGKVRTHRAREVAAMGERATLGLGGPSVDRRADPALYTYEDLVALPTDRYRHELLAGELVLTPAPSPRHQAVLSNLHRVVDAHVRRRELGLVLFAPVDVYFDETTVLQPDLVFVARRHLARVGEVRIEGPPDLVVEVVSQGTRALDTERKRAVYERFRVPQYWVLDPFARTLEEHTLARRRYASTPVSGRSVFRPRCFPGLTIALRTIWD